MPEETKAPKTMRLSNTTTQPICWLMGSTAAGKFKDPDRGGTVRDTLVRSESPTKMYVIPAWDGKSPPYPYRDVTAAEWEAIQKMEVFRASRDALPGPARLVGNDVQPGRFGWLDTKAVIPSELR